MKKEQAVSAYITHILILLSTSSPYTPLSLFRLPFSPLRVCMRDPREKRKKFSQTSRGVSSHFGIAIAQQCAVSPFESAVGTLGPDSQTNASRGSAFRSAGIVAETSTRKNPDADIRSATAPAPVAPEPGGNVVSRGRNPS